MKDPTKQQIPLGYYKKDGTFIGKFEDLGRDWQSAGVQIGDYVVTRDLLGGVTIEVIGYTKNQEGDTIVDKLGYRRLARNNPETRKGIISQIPKALWKYATKEQHTYTGRRIKKLSSKTKFVLNDKGKWIKKEGDTEPDTDVDTSGDVTIYDEKDIPGSGLKEGDIYFNPNKGYQVATREQINQNQVNLDAITSGLPQTEEQKKQLQIEQDVKSLNFKDPETPGSNEGLTINNNNQNTSKGTIEGRATLPEVARWTGPKWLGGTETYKEAEARTREALGIGFFKKGGWGAGIRKDQQREFMEDLRIGRVFQTDAGFWWGGKFHKNKSKLSARVK